MAKSGDIIGAGPGTAIVNAVVASQVPTLTLGQIAAAALSGSSDKEVVVISTVDRTAKVFTGADAAAISAEAGYGDTQGLFTPDGEGKVTPWTGSSNTGALDPVANTTAKPSRSMASLVSSIEDAVTTQELGDVQIVVDQIKGEVDVYLVGDGKVLTGKTPVATFTQTLPDSGTTKNAFE